MRNKLSPYRAMLFLSLILICTAVTAHWVAYKYVRPDKGSTLPKAKEENKPPSEGVSRDTFNKQRKFAKEYSIEISLLLGVASIAATVYYAKRRKSKPTFGIMLFPYKKYKYRSRILRASKYNKIKLPFNIDKEDFLLSMNDAFISLSMIRGKKSEQSDVDGFEAEASSLIQIERLPASDVIAKHNRLLIIGAPGSGKSVLCRNTMYRYSKTDAHSKIPILIELGRQNFTNKSITDLIFEFIRSELRISESLVKNRLNKGVFCIQLDAFDEVRLSDRESVRKGINNFVAKYKENSFIITCRQSVFIKEKEDFTDFSVYSILDFEDKDIENYTRVWKTIKPQLDVEEFQKHLEERSRIKILAHNPLMLSMILYLYAIKGAKLPYSRGEFYKMLSEYLLCTTSHEKDILYRNLKCISHIAWRLQIKEEDADRNIEGDEIAAIIEQVEGKGNSIARFEELRRSGFLLESRTYGITQYKFSHRTLQEYFVSLYIKLYIKDDELPEGESKSNKKQMLLLDYYAKDPNYWQEVVKLYVNICDENVSTLLFQIYEHDKERAISLEMLADAKHIDESLSREILDNYLVDTLPEKWSDETIKALGLIASTIHEKNSIRLIGNRVFDWLTAHLNDVSNSSDIAFEKIALVFAYSYTKEATEILLKHYGDDERKNSVVLKALTLMGNLAISHLGEFAVNNQLKAVDCLIKIGTDRAFLELVKIVMWVESDASYVASRYLSSAQNVERIYLINEDEKLGKVDGEGVIDFNMIDYTWAPFEDENNPVYFIMGRIAYLIKNTPDSLIVPDVDICLYLLVPLRIESTGDLSFNKYGDYEIINELNKIEERETNNSLELWKDKWINVSNKKTQFVFEFTNWFIAIKLSYTLYFFFLMIIIFFYYDEFSYGIIVIFINPILILPPYFFCLWKYPNIDNEIYTKHPAKTLMKIGLVYILELPIFLFFIMLIPILFLVGGDVSEEVLYMSAISNGIFLFIVNMIVWARYRKMNSKNELSDLLRKYEMPFSQYMTRKIH